MSTFAHEHEIVVRSYELDAYRHVNNAAYISWLEDARELFLREEGRDYGFYPDRQDAWFVVVRLDCEYRSSALAAERIVITTRLAALGQTSVTFRQSIRRSSDGLVRARARVVMAFASSEGASTPIPLDFREHFECSPEGDVWTAIEGGERRDPGPSAR